MLQACLKLSLLSSYEYSLLLVEIFQMLLNMLYNAYICFLMLVNLLTSQHNARNILFQVAPGWKYSVLSFFWENIPILFPNVVEYLLTF